MAKEQTKGKTLDIIYFLGLFKKGYKQIIGFGVLGLLFAILTVYVFISPKYSATTDIVVNQKADGTQQQYTAQQADLSAVSTYKDAITKPVVLEPTLHRIKQNNNYRGNIDNLKSVISVDNELNSQIISVNVEDTNAYTAADIANVLAKTFTKKIKGLMDIDNVKIASKAKPNLKPVSPNKKLFLLAGLVLGALIGFVYVFLRDLTDTSVDEVEYLTENLGLTNLGTVYHLSHANRKKVQPVTSIEGVDVEDTSATGRARRRV